MIVDVIFLLHNKYGTIGDFAEFREMVLRSGIGSKNTIRVVLLLKGFSDRSFLVDEISDVVIQVPDCGRDIASYFFYAEQSDADALVFFNTSSSITSEKFLLSAIDSILIEDIGLAGATGSYGGINQPLYFLQLWRHGLCSFPSAVLKMLIATVFDIVLKLFGYSSVPHIRTNAFAVRKDIFLKSKTFFKKNLDTRFNSLMFESGQNGLSGFIGSLGLKMVIVNSNGERFSQDFWMNSKTYAIGVQEKLAVKDNRTEEYIRADMTKRKKISIATWCSKYKEIR